MSGIHQMMIAGADGINRNFTAWGVFGDSTPGVSASAGLTFNSDGTVSYAATANDLSTPGSTSWYSPTVTGIGANYWVRFTATSGTFTTNGASTFTSLASAVSVTKSASAGAASVTFTIEVASDSGGSTIVLTSTSNQLQYTHT